MKNRLSISTLVVLLAFAAAAVAQAARMGDPNTAALQVALVTKGVYPGPVDGMFGANTSAAVRKLQAQLGLPMTGYLGPRTRRALGAYARTASSRRTLTVGMRGWDVAAFQFLLAWHGFPSGAFNGAFTLQTASAVIRFQRWANLSPDGIAGPAVFAALRGSPLQSPIALRWPLSGPAGDPFGPRGDRFHAGIDIVASAGVPVEAAGAGRVVWAGWRNGGWGNEVTIDHGHGVRAIYAHLSAVGVRVGEHVRAGSLIGRVGATGDATGPHLHFELRLRGAAVDPMMALSRPLR